jgi:hypothetical protein
MLLEIIRRIDTQTDKHLQKELLHDIKPTVCLDVISLMASSCGYYRGHIEQHTAQ